jgi:phosphate-selective porin
VATHPFARLGQGRSILSGFYLGAGFALLTDFDDPVIITNPLESRIFKTGDLDGDSGQWLHLEAGYHHGPFLIGIEDMTGSADDVPVAREDDEDMDELTAWVAYVSWNITGEEQRWEKGGWKTAAPSRDAGLWGRWEIAARYSNADIDRDLFDYRLADYAVSTQECRAFSLALNWYPCRYSRLSLGWVKTSADDDIKAFDGEDQDSSFFLSLQARF